MLSRVGSWCCRLTHLERSLHVFFFFTTGHRWHTHQPARSLRCPAAHNAPARITFAATTCPRSSPPGFVCTALSRFRAPVDSTSRPGQAPALRWIGCGSRQLCKSQVGNQQVQVHYLRAAERRPGQRRALQPGSSSSPSYHLTGQPLRHRLGAASRAWHAQGATLLLPSSRG